MSAEARAMARMLTIALALLLAAASARAAELVIEDLAEGTGPAAKAGDKLEVDYTGWLEATGEKFDSSLDRGQPFTFPLGAGRVIRGWDEGLVGMRVGGKRRLVIPPEYGYGGRQVGPIPANSTLIFEVELHGIH
jgi:FKBP-type peptidyl-prolyl cis-trans isomerase FkpA